MFTTHLTLKSHNAKTGPIPVSTTGRQSCPDICPLKKNGCYADSGPLALHWNKVTEGSRGGDWNTLCEQIETLTQGQLWRYAQAGDLPGDGKKINRKALSQLVKANKGKRGFGYTHYPMTTAHNRQAVKRANDLGLRISLSANNTEHADYLAALEIAPVVTIVSEDHPKTSKTPAGRDIVVCPATYKEGVSCATCQLCQRERKTIVAFPVHGTSKKKAAKVITLKHIA